MILIYDRATIDIHSELIGSFRDIYENGFPDADEREDFDGILQRTADELPGQPHTVIMISEANSSTAKGGLIADWYAGSRALHLTYLIVDERCRQQGVGWELVDTGVRSIMDWIKKEKKVRINNVFFESNDPFRTVTDNFDRFLRLRIFAKQGAKLINIPYVQPALDKSKAPVDNLLLFSFTQFNKTGDRIPAEEIKAFLTEFCAGLDVGPEDPVLADMNYCVDRIKDKKGFVQLESLYESPGYNFDKVSVTWHYMELVKGTAEPCAEAPYAQEKCSHFFSFETDLLNYQKQKDPPFSTTFYKYFPDVELVFPGSYMYTSEGLSHIRLASGAPLKIRMSVSFTCVRKTGERMFHVTFAPSEGETFSELDIIKLSGPFASRQEDCRFQDLIRIRVKGRETTIDEFLASLSCCRKDAEYVNQGAGIVQMDINDLPEGKTAVDPDAVFATARTSDEKTLSKELMEFSKALCGIILGIYDYDRMDEEEVFDTIIPILVCRDSFSVTYRGLLFRICRNDDIMERIDRDIIVLPYLLIPDFVLTYNDHVLGDAGRILDDALDASETRDLSYLESRHIEVSDMLSYRYLQDVFQYPSEKEIIEYGNEQHGIKNAYQSVLKRSELLSEVINRKRDSRANRSNALLNALLVLIPLLQLLALLPDGIRYRWWVLFFVAFCGLVAWLIYFRLTRDRHKQG